MKKAISAAAVAVVTLVATAACGAQRKSETDTAGAENLRVEIQPPVTNRPGSGLPPVKAMPRATVFRMSGDYADNVPVDIYPQGRLFSYPAPTDVSEASAPVPLAGGWWLDRRGVGEHTVFTRWTYGEYSALKETPSPREISAAVIPGARVTKVLHLDMTPQEAMADTAAVNAAIAATVPGL